MSLDVEILGSEHQEGRGPDGRRIRRLCHLAADSLNVNRGHLAVQFVTAERIAELNRDHRAIDSPTDVLSFPIDGREDPGDGHPVELGDVVICPAHTVDIPEAIVHGVLHLLGMDHEVDDGEMLALQDRLLAGVTTAADDADDAVATDTAAAAETESTGR